MEGGFGQDLLPCCAATVALVQQHQRARICACGVAYVASTETLVTEVETERPALVPAAPAVHELARSTETSRVEVSLGDQRSLAETVSSPMAGAVRSISRRSTKPGAQPDARVQVADDTKLRPSSVAPVERITHVEAPELLRVRALLCELRPDASGPLGWGPAGVPSKELGSSWTTAERVQTSVVVPAILPGAFTDDAGPSAGAIVAERVERFRVEHPDEGAVIRWMQRHGTLADGLGALYTACALAHSVSSREVRDAWKALPEAMRPAARLGYGRARVEAAMVLWGG